MLKFFLSIYLLLINFFALGAIPIPDANFKMKLLSYIPSIDVSGNGQIEESEAATILKLDLSNSNIQDLTGIEFFNKLDTLKVHGNKLTSILLPENSSVRYINCSKNEISSISYNSFGLKYLDISFNKMASFNYSYSLEYLNCNNNSVSHISVSSTANNFPSLKFLKCENNLLTELRADMHNYLTEIYCSNNQITDLDIRYSTKIKVLGCLFNKIKKLDLSTNTFLEALGVYNNGLNNLDVTNNPNLKELYVGFGNNLTFLDLRKNLSLETFWFCGSPIEYVCVSKDFDTSKLSTCGTRRLLRKDCDIITSLEVDTSDYADKIIGKVYNFYGIEISKESEGLVIISYMDGTLEKRFNYR